MEQIDITNEPIKEVQHFQEYGVGHIKSKGGKIYWVLDPSTLKFNLGASAPHNHGN